MRTQLDVQRFKNIVIVFLHSYTYKPCMSFFSGKKKKAVNIALDYYRNKLHKRSVGEGGLKTKRQKGKFYV